MGSPWSAGRDPEAGDYERPIRVYPGMLEMSATARGRCRFVARSGYAARRRDMRHTPCPIRSSWKTGVRKEGYTKQVQARPDHVGPDANTHAPTHAGEDSCRYSEGDKTDAI